MTGPVRVPATTRPCRPGNCQPWASTREIGSVNERDRRIGCIKLGAGASYALPVLPQERIVFFNEGTGTFSSGEPWARWDAALLARGEAPVMHATETTDAMVLVLPRF